MKQILLVMTALAGVSGFAAAATTATPLAAQGNWQALALADDPAAPPSGCLAASSEGLVLRQDGTGLAVLYRMQVPRLSPVAGSTIELDVGDNSFSLGITTDSGTTLGAAVSDDQLQAIIAAMDGAPMLTLRVGGEAPVGVSLSGADTVMPAFLSCADIPAPESQPTDADASAGLSDGNDGMAQ